MLKVIILRCMNGVNFNSAYQTWITIIKTAKLLLTTTLFANKIQQSSSNM